MDTIGATFGREIQVSLEKISQEAKKERLECAVTIIDELRVILSEEDSKGSPTGYLTVTGWTKLINGWEHHLHGVSDRKIKYTKEFVGEILGREGMYAPPLGILLGEMKSFLESMALNQPAEIQAAA
jgi:hypothetical protein